jgi:hypothetical protein
MTTTEKATEVAVDPLADLDYFSRDMKRRHLAAWRELYRLHRDGGGCRAVANEPDVDNYVGENEANPHYQCSRRVHPPEWKHIASYSGDGGYVIGYWGGAPDDPETEADPEPEPFELVIGTIYKFRNRPTMLMFIGGRPEGKVEVLDLTHQRYRVLDSKQLIPRPADSPDLTPDQLKWVAKFMAERRNKVREVAIKQRADGYFKSAEDLNGILTELGLEPHRPRRSGRFQPEISIRTKGLDDYAARKLLTEWFNALPAPPAGIEFTRPLNMDNVYLNLREEGRG